MGRDALRKGEIVSRSETRSPLSGDTEHGVVMEAVSAATFIMIEPECLFELLVIALGGAAEIGEIDETHEGKVCRRGREPILGRRDKSPR